MELTTTKYGPMLASKNDKYLGRALIEYGEYSVAEVRVLLALLPANGVVVDVGANLGALTIPLAQRADVVVAFEPQRQVFYQLCGNVSLNGLKNVYCFNKAAGNKAGTVMVPELDFTREDNFGAMSLLNSEAFKGEQLPVDIMTVDQLQLGRLDLLKIDVEGMELDVLEGARQTISRCRPHLCVEDDRKELAGPLAKWMVDRGYTVLQHFPRLFNPDNHRGNKLNIYGETCSANLIGFPGEVPGWVKDAGLIPVELK